MKLCWGESQIILEHCFHWEVGGETDDCGEMKSSRFLVGRMVGSAPNYGIVHSPQEWTEAALAHLARRSQVLAYSLQLWTPFLPIWALPSTPSLPGNMPSFPTPSLHSSFPQCGYSSSLRDGKNGIWEGRGVKNPLLCDSIYATLLFYYLQGSDFWIQKPGRDSLLKCFQRATFLPEWRVRNVCLLYEEWGTGRAKVGRKTHG